MSRVARFEVYKDYEWDWRWRLVAINGEIVAQGEAYTRKADCLRAVKAIKRLAAEAKVVAGKARK